MRNFMYQCSEKLVGSQVAVHGDYGWLSRFRCPEVPQFSLPWPGDFKRAVVGGYPALDKRNACVGKGK